jgi:hypothetical protein
MLRALTNKQCCQHTFVVCQDFSQVPKDLTEEQRQLGLCDDGRVGLLQALDEQLVDTSECDSIKIIGRLTSFTVSRSAT